MLTNKEIIHLIDDALQSIWTNEIKEDYECGWLLKEDTVKNAIYFHLRNKLGWIFEENDIRIFTEFTDCEFERSGYRPDIVIARVELDYSSRYCIKAIKSCLAIIEIKYKSDYSSAKQILADYDKLECYLKDLGSSGKLYMATIWEYEDDLDSNWIWKNAAWAKDRITELNASIIRGTDEMQFYLFPH